ncbi:MAG: nucleoside monophosphate kinase, partial [bacterium]|nr:nucleoside monophosphate kinase [bacterium]
GKGTQAELLCRRGGYIHLSTGDLLRGEISGKTEFGRRVKEFIDNGLLVPDEMITGYVLNYIEKNALYKKKVVFDGFPRRIFQAEQLIDAMRNFSSSIDCALLISLSDETVIERLSSRLVCSRCKKVYPGSYEEENCAECNQKLVKRADDNTDVIKKRLSVYKDETEELVGYFDSLSMLRRIDGSGTAEEVFEKILKGLK